MPRLMHASPRRSLHAKRHGRRSMSSAGVGGEGRPALSRRATLSAALRRQCHPAVSRRFRQREQRAERDAACGSVIEPEVLARVLERCCLRFAARLAQRRGERRTVIRQKFQPGFNGRRRFFDELARLRAIGRRRLAEHVSAQCSSDSNRTLSVPARAAPKYSPSFSSSVASHTVALSPPRIAGAAPDGGG